MTLAPVLEINLKALRANYAAIKNHTSAEVAAVVKADAYGLGLATIAPALYAEGCRAFYVAYVEEALALRAIAPDVEIYVLHGVPDIGAAVETRIVPVLNTVEDIARWSAEGLRLGKRLPVVVHVDTGMNRLGIAAGDFATEGLEVRLVMSHLACSEAKGHAKNGEQLEAFRAVPWQGKRSFANSGGVFLGPEYHFDQVRPGAAIYGINTAVAGEGVLRPVVSLTAPVLQVRRAAAGETVGYGANYLAQTPVNLATISVGYADGFFRHLQPQGKVWIHGQACPVVGRVSMDLMVVDVGTLAVSAGDRAEILGERQTADALAAQAGTIGYEVLTSLGKGCKRVYTG